MTFIYTQPPTPLFLLIFAYLITQSIPNFIRNVVQTISSFSNKHWLVNDLISAMTFEVPPLPLSSRLTLNIKLRLKYGLKIPSEKGWTS